MPNVNPLQIKWLIPVLWIVLVVVLLYVPTAIQRRYLLGVQTPLAILAAWGWAVMLKPMPVTRWRFFTVVYLAIGAITPLLIIFSNTIALAKPTLPVFYTADELAGYAWLRANAASTEIVLTVMATDGTGSGGRLVAMTGQRVFMGHWIETVYFKDKQGQLTTFFAPQTTTEWRQIFLDSTGIRYLWYDDYARTFGTWSPTDAPNLELVFQTETVQIYQVMAS